MKLISFGYHALEWGHDKVELTPFDVTRPIRLREFSFHSRYRRVRGRLLDASEPE